MSAPPLLGVNLPWFAGRYGNDLALNEQRAAWGWAQGYDRELPIREARSLGFGAVRIWLCENAEGVVTEGGRIRGVHPALLDAISNIDELAAKHALRVYWTLLDANSCEREGDEVTRAIFTDRDATARFAEHVAAPIARRVHPAHAFGIEVVNEPEALTSEVGWNEIGGAIHTVVDALRSESAVRVSTGTLHTHLSDLWRSCPGLDFADVHVYSPRGALPSRAQLARATGDARLASGEIAIVAGECGMPEHGPPVSAEDAPIAMANYVWNAHDCGYSAAFLWRLERILVAQDTRALTATGERVRWAVKAAAR